MSFFFLFVSEVSHRNTLARQPHQRQERAGERQKTRRDVPIAISARSPNLATRPLHHHHRRSPIRPRTPAERARPSQVEVDKVTEVYRVGKNTPPGQQQETKSDEGAPAQAGTSKTMPRRRGYGYRDCGLRPGGAEERLVGTRHPVAVAAAAASAGAV